MSSVLRLAAHATRSTSQPDVVRGLIVGGCALALILARAPVLF